MTRVAIVAASPVVRAGLEALLAASATVVVGAVSERRDGADVVPLLEVVAPFAADVVLWVPDAPDAPDALLALAGDDGGAPGARADRERGSARGRPAIVVLTDLADPRAAARALRAGARGVLPREASAEEIVAAVDAAAAGLLVVPADLADDLLAERAHVSAAAPTAGGVAPVLTPREREVLALLAQGLANKAIAPRLGISEHTVKAHVAAIFEKLGAGTRAEAVVTAARQGLIML